MTDAQGTVERRHFGRFRSLRLVGVLLAGLLSSILAVYAVGAQQGAKVPASQKVAAALPSGLPNFADLVQAVKPAVVSIRVRTETNSGIFSGDGSVKPFGGSPFEWFFRRFPGPGQRGFDRRFFGQSQGSGFFVSSDGHIVTSNHVVARAAKIEAIMDDGTVLEARIIGSDPKTDLALLKVEGRSDFPFVEFADVSPRVGEWVITMGSPFGLAGTVTAGIVSAHGRDIGAGRYDDFLQIDAAVNRGSSGGPTFNLKGRVIGINTAIYSASGASIGIAFDTPASTAKWVVAQLKEHGHVPRGWLGVRVQPVTAAIAESLGMKEAKGALIADVEIRSPATKAGLKSGDVITGVNGVEVNDARHLARQIAGTAPDSSVTISYLRGGAVHTVNATIKEAEDKTPRAAPKRPGAGDHVDDLGLTLAPAAEVEGAGRQGLAVLRVEAGSKAAELGLAAGDVLLKVGSEAISSAADFNSALATARARGRKGVLVLVKRDERQHYVAVPLAKGQG